MTIKELKEALSIYPDVAEITISIPAEILDDGYVSATRRGCKIIGIYMTEKLNLEIDYDSHDYMDIE